MFFSNSAKVHFDPKEFVKQQIALKKRERMLDVRKFGMKALLKSTGLRINNEHSF